MDDKARVEIDVGDKVRDGKDTDDKHGDEKDVDGTDEKTQMRQIEIKQMQIIKMC